MRIANAEAGFPQNNLDKLMGEGQYAGLEAQIAYDPAIYAQIAAAAIKAWKTLPNKESREQLSKILQRSSEPYSEFIDHLLQVGSRIFGDVDSAMPVVKHLAFENANRFCQEVLRPHRDGDLNDFIRLCRDIDGTHVMGQVIVSALKEGQGRARPRNCFQCGRPGHLKKKTALLAKEQSISLEEIQVFALNVKRERIGPTTVTLRRTVKVISSPGQKTGGGACPGPPKLKCTGP